MNKTLLPLVLIGSLLVGCVKKSDYEKSQADLATEQASKEKLAKELEATKSSLSQVQTELASVKSEADKNREALQKAAAELALTQAKLEEALGKVANLNTVLAKKPEMPIKVSSRKAALGPGLVAMLTNESSKELLVVMSVKNPTLNKVQDFQVRVPARGNLPKPAEFGHAEGWAFSSGDMMMVKHNDFEALKVVVP